MENLAQADEETLQSVPDIGPIVAASIASWFGGKRNQDFLKKLERVGVRAERIKKTTYPQILQGKSVVFTGTLERLSRNQAKVLARERGADVSESVSKKTDFVVVGVSPGSKYKQAKKFGAEILSEQEFLKMVRSRS